MRVLLFNGRLLSWQTINCHKSVFSFAPFNIACYIIPEVRYLQRLLLLFRFCFFHSCMWGRRTFSGEQAEAFIAFKRAETFWLQSTNKGARPMDDRKQENCLGGLWRWSKASVANRWKHILHYAEINRFMSLLWLITVNITFHWQAMQLTMTPINILSCKREVLVSLPSPEVRLFPIRGPFSAAPHWVKVLCHHFDYRHLFPTPNPEHVWPHRLLSTPTSPPRLSYSQKYKQPLARLS